jgi:hypothetical protein
MCLAQNKAALNVGLFLSVCFSSSGLLYTYNLLQYFNYNKCSFGLKQKKKKKKKEKKRKKRKKDIHNRTRKGIRDGEVRAYMSEYKGTPHFSNEKRNLFLTTLNIIRIRTRNHLLHIYA